ncbi:DUF3426 domain-containing protein [uncultured Pseudoteredinibacter sp.]|uniref:DUF3426 domain-containing protein n=1 Tax=uncultured Pseudoteredinibacter sp. TaxID=1641701 RepID=UPI0026350AD9|nr:DUF3426 domain-containing protein [uncultured Pseudoteredinibacter sp.]
MVTRCPACSTAFNVNSQQLASAKGAVRCGSCLQVFKAIDHVVDNGLILNKTTEPNEAADDVHVQSAQASTPESLNSAPSEEPPKEKEEKEPAASWDDYPKSDNAALDNSTLDSSLQSDFQELAIEDNEEDPFSQIDQSLAEQLDQELDEAFSEGLDIEPPTTSQNEASISSFEAPATEAPTAEAIKQEPIETPGPEEATANNDFFNELSQLAEQSLDEAKYEPTSFNSEGESSLASAEADSLETSHLAEANDSTEAANNKDFDKVDSDSNELSLSFDDEPAEELIADKPDSSDLNPESNDLNIEPLQVELEEEQPPVVDNSQEESEKVSVESLEEALTEPAAETNSLALEVEAPVEEESVEEKAEAKEEPRFIDDDTEHFKQKSDTSHNLPQAFTSEHQEQDEEGLDESWALEMMMKELEAAENKSEHSKIEQALDRKHPPEPELFAESEIQSDPFFAPEAHHQADEGPHKESEFDELDLSGQLEDALSMDTIDAGNLSLAQDSEYNLEQADNAQDSYATDNAIEPSFDESTPEQEPLESVDTATIPPVNEEEPSKAEMIDSIEPEPLEMEFRQEKPSWNWLWGSGAFMAIVLAVGQFAWLKFDDLNLQPPYRDLYQTACNFIGCSLPPQVDLSKLKASNLVVRSHPEEEQALVVDMVLLNLANFEQEFPDIQLTFSNIDGKAIARRSFRPAEYLAGELAGASIMPIQRPIHLSLEIVDPGEQAVNYKVDVK